MKIDWFWLFLIVVVVAMVVAGAVSEQQDNALINTCIEKGGQPVVQYGSLKECKQ